MKRTIKFRGKQKTWIYGGISIFEDEAVIYDCNSVANYAYEVDMKSIGQFTGLLDKNGKEIYEGDILKVESEKLMVIGWSEKFASFIINRKDWTFSHWFGESCDPYNYEVVGNIYENPELLKD